MDVREVKRGDIWYARLPSHGTGSVQRGDRPVLVVQNDYISKRSPTVIVAVITSQIKRTDLKSHVILHKVKLPKKSMVACEQVFTLDRKALFIYRCTLDETTMKTVDRALRYCVTNGRSSISGKYRRRKRK